MNKKMREILAKIEAKQKLAKGYTEGENKDYKKAQEILDEIKTLKEEYEIEKRLFEEEKELNKLSEEDTKEITKKIEDKKEEAEEKKVSITSKFAKAVRNMIKAVDLNEGAGASGGYTVPEEIETKVQKLREAKESLRDLITVKPVKTFSGQETYKKRGEVTGFSSVEEGGKIPKAGKPEFSRLSWKVTKYGGYVPITDELIEDSDENIENFVTEWLADEDRVTWNKLVLATVAKNSETDLKDLDGIKNALNITLGSLFKATSVIVTNDDGVNYLDTLKDQNGRYLLNPDPTDSAKFQLRVGANVVPVKAFSNETLKSKENKVPFIIGDLKEGIKGFERKGIELLASKTASVEGLNAFEEDLTLIRGIEREDIQLRDAKAFVNGYITVEKP